MHEVSLCESLLRLIEQQAAEQHFNQVKRVYLELGALAAVEPEALRLGFDAVMKGSVAEGACLEIIPVPAKAWCDQCKDSVEVKQRFDACDRCQAFPLSITAGEELCLKELEVA